MTVPLARSISQTGRRAADQPFPPDRPCKLRRRRTTAGDGRVGGTRRRSAVSAVASEDLDTYLRTTVGDLYTLRRQGDCLKRDSSARDRQPGRQRAWSAARGRRRLVGSAWSTAPERHRLVGSAWSAAPGWQRGGGQSV